MSHHSFGARHFTLALTGLDFGLRVRVEVRPAQRTVFSGADNPSAQELASELVQSVSRLRVYSFPLRAQLEAVTSALLVNVQSGFWPQAERAALDLAELLSEAGGYRLADGERCTRAERSALRLADLCEEVQ